MDNFPSPSARKPVEERKEETILCNVCVEKNEKDKKQADMYCYICDTVYCDNHAGVRYPIMSSPLANIIIIFLCVSVIQFTTLQ